jgi:hypothetical protein
MVRCVRVRLSMEFFPARPDRSPRVRGIRRRMTVAGPTCDGTCYRSATSAAGRDAVACHSAMPKAHEGFCFAQLSCMRVTAATGCGKIPQQIVRLDPRIAAAQADVLQDAVIETQQHPSHVPHFESKFQDADQKRDSVCDAGAATVAPPKQAVRHEPIPQGLRAKQPTMIGPGIVALRETASCRNCSSSASRSNSDSLTNPAPTACGAMLRKLSANHS